MRDALPRPRPQYLQRHKTRHGKMIWIVRVGRGPLTRLRAEYGTQEFQAEYEAALKGEKPAAKQQARAGSMKWLWDRYRETTAWAELSPATRRQRENIMDGVLATAGHEPCTAINAKHVEDGKDRRRDTPAQARNYLDALRGLFRWAKRAKHVTADPTLEIENPKRKKGKGFPVWTEADIAAYHKKWPIGTKERVWLDVLLYTGPRRGDVVKLGRQHIKSVPGAQVRVISFKTEKGGEMIDVDIPILPVLEVTLAAGPCGTLTFICGEKGKPLTKESFGNAFSAAAREAGVQKSAHGVRKIAATTAADNGATVWQLMAIFGWKTAQMAEYYTREANRKRLASEAMHMLGRTADEQAKVLPNGG